MAVAHFIASSISKSCGIRIPNGEIKYIHQYLCLLYTSYGSADEMIDDENVDIVYIATPHNLHYRFLVQSLKAGKHVFCEKAITVNDLSLIHI